MTGRKPITKDSSTRSRCDKDQKGMRVITITPNAQPRLLTIYFTDDPGKKECFPQSLVTVRWWKMWGKFPLSGDFTAND
ncbi:hypothetical protein IWX65_002732 [Arthrobacter sp. CAN_A214]|uniref:hypothetical protein n=1 Tax=Arthrobacter sp. CAN_A214 TaxID=2787720 RepID=UPI0018CA3EFF